MTEKEKNIDEIIEQLCERIIDLFKINDGDVDPYDIIAMLRNAKPLFNQ